MKPDTLLHSRHAVTQLLVALLVLLLLMFAGKGTLRQMALQRQHLTVTTSQFLNDMVPNGAIALKYAWDSRRESQQLSDPLVGVKAMGFPTVQAAALALGLPAGSEAEVKAALYQHDPLPLARPRKTWCSF